MASQDARNPRRVVFDLAVYLLVRMILCAIQTLSLQQCEVFATMAGWLLGDVLGVRRRVIADNLRQAFPTLPEAERHRIARAMWRHLFLLLCEMSLAERKIHETNWRDHVRLQGARDIVERMLSTRPLVVVTAHFGNFELSGYLAGLFGCATYTIVRPLDNPYLDRFLKRFRERTGQHLFPSHGSADLAQAVLESGGTLAILGDHHAGRKGCWVEFFGRPASCHKSVALFPLVNQLPLMVLVTTRDASPMQFTMRTLGTWDPRDAPPEMRDVTALTQWYTGLLEDAIRELPEQYWWVHRRWKPRT